MLTVVAVGLSGAIGALARYAIDTWMGQHEYFPWDTFLVNVSGAFLLGLIFALLVERGSTPQWLKSALTVGLLGAYTTFSTLSYETLRLIEGRSYWLAALNGLGSLAAGLVAVYVGMELGRALSA